MEIEAQPLIHEKSELEFTSLHRSRGESKLRSRAKAITTHVLVAVSTLLVVIIFNVNGDILSRNIWGNKAQPSMYSPMTPAVEYVIDEPPEDYWSNELYFGPPSDESERAWNAMIHPHGLQVFPDEAKRFDELDTVRLKNGNPLFIMGVYHNLHCLRKIRQTLNADHYYPNITEEWRQFDLHHTLHCLESIRTSIMCHPDFTPNRFFWSGRTWHDLTVAPNVKRECVNWDRVTQFMRARNYDPDETMHGDITHGEFEGRAQPHL